MCCYNSSDVVVPTLNHLANLNTKGIDAELIFVDNASTDNTTHLAMKRWKILNEPFPVKFVFEPNPGLMLAREKGIEVSTFDYIVFVDDDNWIANDFIQVVSLYFNNHPDTGAIGSNNSPVFERDKPFWFDKFENWYAVGSLTDKEGNLREIGLFGAGLSIRKSVYVMLKKNGFESCLSGRLKDSLVSGEDYELCKAIYLSGWNVVWLPQLRLKHFIKPARLNWNYFRQLNIGESKSILFFLAYEYWINKRSRIFTFFTFSWGYLFVKASLKSFILGLKIFFIPSLKNEGSTTLILFDRSKVLLNSLIHHKKRYRALKMVIKKAQWRDRNKS